MCYLALIKNVAQLTASGVPAITTSDIRLSFLFSSTWTVAPENCLKIKNNKKKLLVNTRSRAWYNEWYY